MGKNHEVARRELEVAFPSKAPIKCVQLTKHPGDLSWANVTTIFTHGAGGTLQADAVVNFAHGFVSTRTMRSILCFQGNMNLASRVKMFTAILVARETSADQTEPLGPACLGGRSMGARAAVQATTEKTRYLALVSYPLQSKKEIRDRILLELPASVKVIFVIGDRDEMCDFEKLEEVRGRMTCKTWRIVVRDADHGMNVRPKTATRAVGEMTGALVATWLDDCDESLTEGVISWDSDKSIAQWSGWYEKEKSPEPLKNPASQTGDSQKLPPESALKYPDRKHLQEDQETMKIESEKRRKI